MFMNASNDEKTYKTNISSLVFHLYLIFISLFIAIFSINFLINQFVEKQNLINSIIPDLKPGITDDEYDKLYIQAKQVWNLWSLPSYFGGLSTILIFFVFVLFGRTKVKYGYFFRTIWAIIFVGAAIFVFFIVGIPMWQKIVNSVLISCLAIVSIFDLLKVNKKREELKFEIRNEWSNIKNNKDVRRM